MQNGFIERFSGSFQLGVLDMHVFRNPRCASRWRSDLPITTARSWTALAGLHLPNSGTKTIRRPRVMVGPH